jgi:hypothetical protein
VGVEIHTLSSTFDLAKFKNIENSGSLSRVSFLNMLRNACCGICACEQNRGLMIHNMQYITRLGYILRLRVLVAPEFLLTVPLVREFGTKESRVFAAHTKYYARVWIAIIGTSAPKSGQPGKRSSRERFGGDEQSL